LIVYYFTKGKIAQRGLLKKRITRELQNRERTDMNKHIARLLQKKETQ